MTRMTRDKWDNWDDYGYLGMTGTPRKKTELWDHRDDWDAKG